MSAALRSFKRDRKQQYVTPADAFDAHRTFVLANDAVPKRVRRTTAVLATVVSTPVAATVVTPSSKRCCICLDKPANTRLLPCRHDEFCNDCCVASLTEEHNKRQKKRGTQPHLLKEPVKFKCSICQAPVLSMESSSTPTQPPPPPDSTPNTVVQYRDALATSMHMNALAIDKLIYTSPAWLCDNAIDLALNHCNREQGPSGITLFISSLFLIQSVNLVATTSVVGRQPAHCNTIVKCINMHGNHWIAAVWSRSQPHTVFVLDSMAAPATNKRKRATPYSDVCATFLQFCQHLIDAEPHTVQLELLPTARQDDGSSCGLFVIEYARVLAQPSADITSTSTRRQLELVNTVNTRQWLHTLSNTLGNATSPHTRSPASTSNRTYFDESKAEAAEKIE